MTQTAPQNEAQEAEEVPLFERERKANIARNKERLALLGLQSDDLAAAMPQGESGTWALSAQG